MKDQSIFPEMILLSILFTFIDVGHCQDLHVQAGLLFWELSPLVGCQCAKKVMSNSPGLVDFAIRVHDQVKYKAKRASAVF